MKLELSREYEEKLSEIANFIKEKHGVEYSVDELISQLIEGLDTEFEVTVRSDEFKPDFNPPFIPIAGSDGIGPSGGSGVAPSGGGGGGPRRPATQVLKPI